MKVGLVLPKRDGYRFAVFGDGFYGLGDSVTKAMEQARKERGRAFDRAIVYYLSPTTTIHGDGSFSTAPNDDGSYSMPVLAARIAGNVVTIEELPGEPVRLDDEPPFRVRFDIAADVVESTQKRLRSGLVLKVVNPDGPGGGNPEVELSGDERKVRVWLQNNGYRKGDFEVVADDESLKAQLSGDLG